MTPTRRLSNSRFSLPLWFWLGEIALRERVSRERTWTGVALGKGLECPHQLGVLREHERGTHEQVRACRAGREADIVQIELRIRTQVTGVATRQLAVCDDARRIPSYLEPETVGLIVRTVKMLHGRSR